MRKQNLFFAAVLCVGALASCDTASDGIPSFRNNPGKHISEDNVEYYIPSPADTVINNYGYVDLGLPSSSLWATTNVGATTICELGTTFRWGETQYVMDSHWENYKYSSGTTDYSKYNATDGKMILDSEDDAAFVNCGTWCHTPSVDDINELNKYCTWTYTIGSTGEGDYMSGFLVTSKVNGKMMFLPVNRDQNYWINSLSNEKVAYALNLVLDEGDEDIEASHEMGSSYRKTSECVVRAVYNRNYKYGDAYDTETEKETETDDESGTFIDGSQASYVVPSQADVTINGHGFVDLGLPSGLLWGRTDIGAETPADYGDTFKWGETEPSDNHYWEQYKYSMNSKYNAEDGKSVLENEDDVAYMNLGKSCRIPSPDDIRELNENCTWKWTVALAKYGDSKYVKGYLVTSKINGKSIFLHNSEYWLNTLSPENVSFAYSLSLTESYYSITTYTRYQINCIRPVATK